MKKLVFLLILAMLACEASAYSVRFDLRDYTTSERIKEGTVSITAVNENVKKSFSFILDNTSEVMVGLPKPGSWNFEITVDQVGTPANDYYVRHYTEIEEEFSIQRIFLFRVASIRGRVEDINRNLVSDALVRIECEDNRFIRVSLNTDFFGTFQAENIPTGNCVAYASFQDAAGLEEFFLEKGEIKSIVVKLDRRVMSTAILLRRYAIWGVLGAAGLGLLFFFLIKQRRSHREKPGKKKPGEKKDMHEDTPIKTEDAKDATKHDRGHTLIEIDHSFDEETSSSIEKDEEKRVIPSKLKQVMETLKENERQVVQYLINNNMESKLSKIRYSLKIPKTTFFRIIKSLKDKKITIEDPENPRKVRINKDLL